MLMALRPLLADNKSQLKEELFKIVLKSLRIFLCKIGGIQYLPDKNFFLTHMFSLNFRARV